MADFAAPCAAGESTEEMNAATFREKSATPGLRMSRPPRAAEQPCAADEG